MAGLVYAAMAGAGVQLLVGWSWDRTDGRVVRRAGNELAEDHVPWRRLAIRGVAPALPAAGLGCLAGLLVFGPRPAALLCAAATVIGRTVLHRRRAERDAEETRDHWPRLIEELRILTGSAGRPIPQALLEVGVRSPAPMDAVFVEAQREWALTTDFSRTVHVLKVGLSDATADVVLETLLTAHDVGGDIDDQLAALAEDRRTDLHHRKEAVARQAGARVARWFVIIVPAGMAFVGMSLDGGAAAFRTAGGQVAATLAIGLVAACWYWAGRIMHLPPPDRVFER